LLGTSQAAAPPAAAQAQSRAAAEGAFDADRATLSAAGSEVAQTAADGGVRMEKVAGVQAALASGTYSVPAQAVASKMVDAMLAGNR
jgi:negative regulator of flagellin synthesis FlgM